MFEKFCGSEFCSCHFLIVGDEDGELDALVNILEGAGYGASRAAGADALETAPVHGPTFALLAPSLSDGTAAGLCRMVAAAPEFADVSCLLVVPCGELSAGRQELLDRGLAEGALAWPSSSALVLSWVKAYVGHESARRCLAESRRNYLRVFDRMPVVMMFIDPATGHVVDVNAAAERFYGASKTEFRRKRIWEINTASRQEIIDAMERTRKMESSNFHFKHRLCDGSVRDVSVHTGPIDIHGRQLLYSIVFDITASKEAEAP